MRILYLDGDRCSPKYIAGALRAAHHDVDARVRSRLPARRGGATLVLLSDVTRESLGPEGDERVRGWVESGTGLVVVGGWNALGRGGYARGALAELLPVELIDGDDRQNAPSGVLLQAALPHPVLRGLPFEPPPVVTGFNRVRPRPGARVPLVGRPIEGVSGDVARLGAPEPLLVLGQYGAGRVAVLATDLGPHWSGGWTDWGGSPVDTEEGEQVGAGYVRFLDQVCNWAVGEPESVA